MAGTTGFFHHIGTFLLFSATVLLIITCISAPVVDDLALLKVELGGNTRGRTVTFGTFGWCVNNVNGGNNCSPSKVGYSPAAVMSSLDRTEFSDYAEDTTRGLTRAMILHPISCGLNFIAFLLALGAGVVGSFLASLVALLAFLATAVACVIDFVLFSIVKSNVNDRGNETGTGAYYGAASWTLLVSAICSLLGAIVVFFTCCSARLHRRRSVMSASIISELARRNRHSLRTLRQSPVAEISGALGDLGTLLPLMIALASQGSIDLSSTLVFSGLFNIVTGAVFGIPLPVQPMKAIAASALSTPLSLQITTAAGALVSCAVLLLTVTGALRLLTRNVPVPVIKGIQLGAALRLVISGGNLILPLPWCTALPQIDNRLVALCAFLLLLLNQRSQRFPYALLIFLLGLSTIPFLPSDTTQSSHSPSSPFRFGLPLHVTIPDFTSQQSYTTSLSQLPLTTLNSILAVSALSADLLPSLLPPPTPTALGYSVAAMNLVGCWFGAMPVCHGAGGLAGQVRFGARSGAAAILLGVVKMVLGFVTVTFSSSSGRGYDGVGTGIGDGNGGEVVISALSRFPRGLLGVMVIAAGLELGKVGAGLNTKGAVDLWEERAVRDDDGVGIRGRWREVGVAEQHERWMVMMVTAAGILAFKNDAVGFLAGCCCHGAYKVADWVERRQSQGLLGERRPLLR
ncbi:pali-domain-containing protein [Parathielavia appendiculata]|uniref:Pali-domain-containing protein n=1 Tax=Parathielavia appendiculata TaxID=2587402 RepID=A0AAN6Z0H6_9PEZI|nr:pali-domain-containing protein [Parathielavia appendiculata]